MNELIVMDYTRLQRYNTKIMNWVKNLISSSSDSGVPVGSIMFFTKSEAPEGWLFCNGASVSSVDYSNLYAVIGTTFGGDASNFKLPDLRNQFLRGVSSGLSPTTNFGIKYPATAVPYIYAPSGKGIDVPTTGASNADANTKVTASRAADSVIGGGTNAYYMAATVRPANMGLLPCIKY